MTITLNIWLIPIIATIIVLIWFFWDMSDWRDGFGIGVAFKFIFTLMVTLSVWLVWFMIAYFFKL
jgi:hypothetical protein